MASVLYKVASLTTRCILVIALASILLVTLATVFLGRVSLFHLSESQVLYLASAGAQVVAALYGLTIAGYSFFTSRFGPTAEDESFDTYKEIEQAYHREIILLSVSCAIAILSLLATIVIEGQVGFECVSNLVLNSAGLWFALSLVAIVGFVVQVVNPNQAKNFSRAAQDAINGPNTQEGNLAEFLRTYNEAQRLVWDKANKETGADLPNKGEMCRPLKLLWEAGAIPGGLFGELNALRKYRNYVVHSPDDSRVPKEMNDRMDEVLSELKDAFDKPR